MLFLSLVLGAPLPVLILSAVRTPLGALGGSLKTVDGVTLGSRVLREAVSQAGGAPIREVVMGCAFQAGMGPNPARQAARGAGLDAPAWTLNQLDGSAFMALIQAARTLEAGPGGWVAAGAFESVSSAPYLVPAARWGQRMGETQILDPLLWDGPPWFAQAEVPSRMRPASPGGTLEPQGPQILPVEVRGRNRNVLFTADEGDVNAVQAPPADGAAAVVLGLESMPGRLPLARLLGYTLASPAAEALDRLASKAGIAREQIQTPEARGPRLALGGLPLLVDALHAKQHRYLFFSLATGDGQDLSLLLELL
jgi:hypothetical protein